jgi:hypothetical protein
MQWDKQGYIRMIRQTIKEFAQVITAIAIIWVLLTLILSV